MQEYKDIDIDSLISDGPDTINKNFKTLMSNNAGVEFPTYNLYAGMICYRSDEGKTYTLKNDLTTWVELFDVSGANGAVTPKADALTKTLTVAEGGTGATTGSAACSNIGAVQTVNDTAPDENGNVNVAGVPVGFEYFTTNPNVQAGSLPLVGGLCSRELYADLWAWVQQQGGYCISEAEWQALAAANNGAVPYYSSGDGKTTFRVPALTVWCKGASSIEEVGDYLLDSFASHKHDVSANTNSTGSHSHTASTDKTGGHTHTRGTMDIKGTFDGNIDDGTTYKTGAFYQAGSTSCGANGGEGGGQVGFQASKNWTGSTSSNGEHSHTVTIQSDGEHSHTVTITETTKGGTETRPKTIIGLYCVIAFGTVTSGGSVNLNTVQEVLEQTQQAIQTADLTNVVRTADIADVSRYHVVGETTDRPAGKPTYGLE